MLPISPCRRIVLDVEPEQATQEPAEQALIEPAKKFTPHRKVVSRKVPKKTAATRKLDV